MNALLGLLPDYNVKSVDHMEVEEGSVRRQRKCSLKPAKGNENIS